MNSNSKNEQELRYNLYCASAGLCKDETEEILKHLTTFPSPNYAEVGVYFGGTFFYILNFLSKTKDNYFAYGIDLFEDFSINFNSSTQTHEPQNKYGILNVAVKSDLESKLKDLGFSNFELIKGNSDECLNSLGVILDVVLIDGNHTYLQCNLDFEAALTKCHPGSIIVFDNSSNDIEPDPRYVEADGGPWKVCLELKNDSRLTFLNQINRCSFFKVNE